MSKYGPVLDAPPDGAYALTAVNGPTFVTDRGYTCDGSNDYLDSGFNYASGGMFASDSAHVSAYLNANSTVNVAAATVGASTTSTNTNIRPGGGGNSVGVQLNSALFFSSIIPPSALGFRLVTRVTASQVQAFTSDEDTTISVAAGAPFSTSLMLMRRGANYQQGRIAFASVGAGLTSAEAVAFRARMLAFLTAIGAA